MAVTVKTASSLYDVKESYLRVLCTRGVVRSTLVGGRHYITPAEMDRVFLGLTTPLSACRPKPEAVKDKISLREITKKYGVSDYSVMNDKRLKPQKLNGRWFFIRTEVERVFGANGK